MRKIYVLLLFFLFSGLITAQTYHTITVDENNDFDAATSKISTSTTGFSAYVTWDNENLYLGYEGSDIGTSQSNDKWLVFYFDVDPNENPLSGNGTNDAIGFGNQDWTLPFNADYMLQIRSVAGADILQKFDGSEWSSISTNVQVFDNNDANYLELKLPLSELGSPDQINLLGYFINEQSGSEWTFGIFPSTSLSDGNQSNGEFSDFYNFYLGEEYTPNSSTNINNYQWLVRLKAETSALADTNIYAGMATNATDGFDAGLDLAKAPNPPSNFISLYFDDPNFTDNGLGSNASRNIKKLVSLDSNTTMWDFIVETDVSETVTLSATDFDFVPDNYEIKIKDVSADVMHDVKTSAYTFTSTANEEKQFQLIVGVTLEEANISVAPTSISFGPVLVDSSQSSNIVIRNTGEEALTISNIESSNSVFAITGSTSFTLNGSEADTITVTFTPTTETSYSETLTITSNDADTPSFEVPLSGSGQANLPEISTSKDTLQFGSIYTGSDSSLTIKIYNSGTADLNIDSVVATNSDFSVTTSTDFAIAKNDSSSMTFKFAPTDAGAVTDTMLIYHDDSDLNPYLITVSGTGVIKTPTLVLSTDTLAFGSVRVSYDSTLTFDISNDGLADLSVTNITSDVSYFTITSQTSFTLNPGDTTTVTVKFSPELVTDTSATITITSNEANSPHTIGVSGSGTTADYSKSLSAGWNLISVPVQPTNAYRADVVGDDFSSYQLYDYSSTAGYQNADSVNCGNGYWLGITSSGTLDVEGTPLISDYSSTLNGGWNIVATPFNKAYDSTKVYFTKDGQTKTIDDAVTDGWITAAFYGYDGTNYNSTTSLQPWSGYWFSALEESVTMLFYYDSAGTQLSKERPVAPKNTIDNWDLDILASFGDYHDSFLKIGAAKNATDGFDPQFDTPNPPASPSGKGIETYFEYSNWNKFFSKYASDIRTKYEPGEQARSWEFKVRTGQAGKATLSWENILTQVPEEIKSNFEFKLGGYGITGSIDMMISSEYKFNAEENSIYTFTINASVTGIEEDIIPTDFALEQNYPNPFNPSTNIKFALPQATNVRLSIFNLLGEEVEVLVNGQLQSGIHTVEFDASNLTSGMYFYRISTNEFTDIKKMILMK